MSSAPSRPNALRNAQRTTYHWLGSTGVEAVAHVRDMVQDFVARSRAGSEDALRSAVNCRTELAENPDPHCPTLNAEIDRLDDLHQRCIRRVHFGILIVDLFDRLIANRRFSQAACSLYLWCRELLRVNDNLQVGLSSDSSDDV